MQKEEIETMLKDRSERLAIMRDLEADRDRLIMAKVIFLNVFQMAF